MANMIGGIISLAVGAIVLANVFVSTINGTNTTGWTSADTALWSTITLVGIAGFLYGTAAVFGLF